MSNHRQLIDAVLADFTKAANTGNVRNALSALATALSHVVDMIEHRVPVQTHTLPVDGNVTIQGGLITIDPAVAHTSVAADKPVDVPVDGQASEPVVGTSEEAPEPAVEEVDGAVDEDTKGGKKGKKLKTE